MFPNVKLKSWNIRNYTKMHISYKNRLLWQIKVTHPLAEIFYNRFTYPWRFTRVPSVFMVYIENFKTWSNHLCFCDRMKHCKIINFPGFKISWFCVQKRIRWHFCCFLICNQMKNCLFKWFSWVLNQKQVILNKTSQLRALFALILKDH